MGAKATAVDLRTRSDTEYFGDVRGGVEAAGPGTVERFILWEVEGDWLLVRASTFLTPEKVSRVSADDDLRRFLTSLRPA